MKKKSNKSYDHGASLREVHHHHHHGAWWLAVLTSGFSLVLQSFVYTTMAIYCQCQAHNNYRNCYLVAYMLHFELSYSRWKSCFKVFSDLKPINERKKNDKRLDT